MCSGSLTANPRLSAWHRFGSSIAARDRGLLVALTGQGRVEVEIATLGRNQHTRIHQDSHGDGSTVG